MVVGLGQRTWATSQSNSFRIEEDFIGGGGLIEESSANYRASESIGDFAVGESSSTNFQTNSGYTTTDDPALSFQIETANAGLGNLSIVTTAKGTATFTVTNYTSYGYIVLMAGNTLKNEPYNHSLPAMSPAGPATPGTEQFGLNLVANTGFGANPEYLPSSDFSSGQAVAGYNTADNFKFASGDTIAEATRTSGKTRYTLSYVANVDNRTPAGTFEASHTLIVVGTY